MIRNQTNLLNRAERELNQIEKQYCHEVIRLKELTTTHAGSLDAIILNHAQKSYWFFALSRYHSQLLSDLRTLDIFKKKLKSEQFLIRIREVQNQLERLESYVVKLKNQQPSFVFNTAIVTSIVKCFVIICTVVAVAILVFAAVCADPFGSQVPLTFAGIFLITPLMAYTIANFRSVDF